MIVRFVLAGLILAGCIGEVSMEDPDILDPEAIRPFTISVPDEVLADLQDRLERTRLPDQIPATGWDYGTNLAYLDELLEFWQEGFDWRGQERQLNQFDHFKTVIDGVDLHFVHQRSPDPDAVPLLLIHGWPGSIVEFTGIIGPLTQPEGDGEISFHIVAPSLPGFGFSGKPSERGYSPCLLYTSPSPRD